MRAVCAEAARLGVAVGAQVSYDDREHFGRVARDVPADVLTEQVADQVGTLTEIAVAEGAPCPYLKPHGALYHRVRDDAEQAAAVLAGSGHLPVLGQPGALLGPGRGGRPGDVPGGVRRPRLPRRPAGPARRARREAAAWSHSEHLVERTAGRDDLNASGDVVGGSTSPQVGNTGYIWFADSQRMVQLPFKGRWAAANAVSDVRVADGTRLVVGMNSSGAAVVWVVANP